MIIVVVPRLILERYRTIPYTTTTYVTYTKEGEGRAEKRSGGSDGGGGGTLKRRGKGTSQDRKGRERERERRGLRESKTDLIWSGLSTLVRSSPGFFGYIFVIVARTWLLILLLVFFLPGFTGLFFFLPLSNLSIYLSIHPSIQHFYPASRPASKGESGGGGEGWETYKTNEFLSVLATLLLSVVRVRLGSVESVGCCPLPV
ncbi:hypothetical protein F4809DRAFT_141604 [Biscogniauxia mediterranea]|nr:hypothetical protein F4809DRAFT_141604 [Biscogniauxia mediterranea]